MPKRTDIKSILIIGAGPIIIGQGCEFDYSGVQACKALQEEGYRIILVNSNPATIMTDPSLAHATYIESIHWKTIQKIIEKERPDALLPTMGGQTALNCSVELVQHGVLDMFKVELIGASMEAIERAENRETFRTLMKSIGLNVPKSFIAKSMEECFAAMRDLNFPIVIRPSFTLGGSGGGIAYDEKEFQSICERGFSLSLTQQLLIEESLLGWKEFEMEVVRDSRDNCIIVCGIENIDPMGVHTGDSITVAPIQTLTDKEYQLMRNAAIQILRAVGVETGGANVQFAVHPGNGRMMVIEMNPRVSRSSALASKATGFPIAKIAAKLAVGYTLNELQNDITGGVIPASFEPTIDYVVTKIPRFDFEKFPHSDPYLTTQMKSVGEAMGIGRTFKASLQKAIASLEIGKYGFGGLELTVEEFKLKLKRPCANRLFYIGEAFRLGISLDEVQALTGIDFWFLREIQELIEMEQELIGRSLDEVSSADFRRYKKVGFTDFRLAELLNTREEMVRHKRWSLGVRSAFKRVDSCAAEFPSVTTYLYGTYEEHCEAFPTKQKKIIILGGGPNRIGQGIEFDYCCVQAAYAIKAMNAEAIMINCNPETVSTDYDTSDRLYFEPLTLESVLEIVNLEKPDGVIVQYGGQTPLKLAMDLKKSGVPIIGTSPEAIDLAENRAYFQELLYSLSLKQPRNITVFSVQEGLQRAGEVGFPLVVRPSYVLGGRAMEIVYNTEELNHYLTHAMLISNNTSILLDRFLDDAIEVDVDGVSDGESILIAGIMEHVEEAGVHSGDSACSLPPFSLSQKLQKEISEQVRTLIKGLGIIGLFNVQLAIQEGEIYFLEVNPRASRTVPFVSKAMGMPIARWGVMCMMGKTLKELEIHERPMPSYFSVKHAVFSFNKFPGVDPILGPEMKSTGEVMAFASSFGEAFAKGLEGIIPALKLGGLAFLSVRDKDKKGCFEVARQLLHLGFELIATSGTAAYLRNVRIPCRLVKKVTEGQPNVIDLINNRKINFIVNTTEGKQSIQDSHLIRCSAVSHQVNYTTTLAGARAIVKSLQHLHQTNVYSLQELNY